MALMGKYIYCFIKENKELRLGLSEIGNLNAPVYTINYEEISAVVSDAPIIEYLPKRKNLMAHQKIVSMVMEKYAIIPVAFGTVANNKKEIITIINSRYNEFIDNIEYLDNKIELGLKVKWDEKYFNEDIENSEIKELKKLVSGKDEKKVLNEKIELGKLVEASILQKREDYIDKIYKQVSDISVEAKLKENVPIKTIFNGYFLVEKSRLSEFDKKVQQISEAFENKLILNYTGPWPPYNFVNINITVKG